MNLVLVAGGGSYCSVLARNAGVLRPRHVRFTSTYARDLVARERRQHRQGGGRGIPLSSKIHSRSFSQLGDSQEAPAGPSSVSANEVSHFSALASSWWDPHGPSRLLHLMNPLRHDFIRRSLALSSQPPDSSQQLTYLDIGCGGGIFSCSAALLPSTKSVTGIDPTGACIDAALAHARTDPALRPPSAGGKLTFLHTAIEDLDRDDTSGGVDIVTIFEVVEHVTSPAGFLRAAAAHLRPGGWLIGSTIARHPLSYVTTKLLGEAPVIGVVPPGTHDWNKYINPQELQRHFETDDADEKAGWRWANFHVQGVVYVPGLGWREVSGSETVGNYFFGVQKVAV